MNSDEIPSTPGERVRYFRELAGMSQMTLEQMSGVKKSAIHAWETGAVNLHPEWTKHRLKVELMAKALAVDPSDIWGESTRTRPEGQTIPWGGVVPCAVDEYAGLLEGSASPNGRRVGLDISSEIKSHVDEVVEVQGSSLSPRVMHGDYIGVSLSRTPVSGVIHLVVLNGSVMVCGLQSTLGRWYAFDMSSGVSVPFDGDVIGRVTLIEGNQGDGGLYREFNRNGILMVSARHPMS